MINLESVFVVVYFGAIFVRTLRLWIVPTPKVAECAMQAELTITHTGIGGKSATDSGVGLPALH